MKTPRFQLASLGSASMVTQANNNQEDTDGLGQPSIDGSTCVPLPNKCRPTSAD